MTGYYDTNVLVAAVLVNHPQHLPAEAAVRKVQSREIQGWISAHTLAEFYAVLTRLPVIPAIYPSEAWQILERDIFPHFEVVSLTADEYRQTLQVCAAAGWTGGCVYDALHAAAARKAGCDQLYTFNLRHFRELAPDLPACRP